MKNLYCLLIIISIFFVGSVSASNNVDYKLTITKNYDFKEEINYSLTDYKQISNGDNYFARLIADPVYSDIEYKTKYNKTASKSNGIYKVKLSHTYSEYGMGNANFLNNCFEESNYKYDMDTISFTGTGGFNCLYGDSLKITLVTDFEVTETNAIVSGNTYTWNPTDINFNMNIKLNKAYESSGGEQILDDDHIGMNDEQDTDNDNNQKEKSVEKENSSVNWTVVLIVIGLIFVTGIIMVFVLISKNNKASKL